MCFLLLNARHPGVLLKTIKIYKYHQNTTKYIILYHFWNTRFDSLESSSGPLVNTIAPTIVSATGSQSALGIR